MRGVCPHRRFLLDPRGCFFFRRRVRSWSLSLSLSEPLRRRFFERLSLPPPLSLCLRRCLRRRRASSSLSPELDALSSLSSLSSLARRVPASARSAPAGCGALGAAGGGSRLLSKLFSRVQSGAAASPAAPSDACATPVAERPQHERSLLHGIATVMTVSSTPPPTPCRPSLARTRLARSHAGSELGSLPLWVGGDVRTGGAASNGNNDAAGAASATGNRRFMRCSLSCTTPRIATTVCPSSSWLRWCLRPCGQRARHVVAVPPAAHW